MSVAPLPQQLTMGGMPGERVPGSQHGCTALDDLHNIKIHYNAEIRDLDCCERLCICWASCGLFSYDKARSYLYVRENSVETNIAFKCVCNPTTCKCNDRYDHTQIYYFDMDPFKKEDACCGLLPLDPKLEVVDTGFMFLCMKCCSDKKVVIMPYEKACCGCVNNRSTTCDSCFGLFGPIAGNPKTYYPFRPQPVDAQAFVNVAALA